MPKRDLSAVAVASPPAKNSASNEGEAAAVASLPRERHAIDDVHPPVVLFFCRHEDLTCEQHSIAVSRFTSEELLELKRLSNLGTDWTYGDETGETPPFLRAMATRLGWCYPLDHDAEIPEWMDHGGMDPLLGEDVPPHNIYAVISGLDDEPCG